MGVER